jgi:Carboxypeptidase regulatory-like domain
MTRSLPLRSVLLSLFLLCLTALGYAQGDTARLQGTVTDEQGAAVAGVDLTVTNTNTDRTVSVTTNDLGYYTVSALPAGHYRVEVTLKGFKKVSRELELQVAQIGVADFQLTVGVVTETITVEAGSPVIDPADSALGEVIEGRQVTELPLNGRNFTQLALLIPGVTRGNPTGAATGANGNAETFRFGQSGGAALSVNGLRPQNDNFVLDGIDNNEALVNTIVFFPPADAIDEFRVQTSLAPAQFGRAGGALVVTSIKSGTNDIHGSAFWFNRNTNLNAHAFFDTPHTPTPGFNRNQFGGTVGGPVIKNKFFMFGDYEGLRQKIPGSPEYATVPTDLMRQGNFSELLDSTLTSGLGQLTYTILDPTTGAQFMGTGAQPNVIPTNRLNPVGLAFIRAFPEPNCTHAQDVNCHPIYHNYKNTRKTIENWNDFDFRGDYNVSTANSFFVRVSRGRVDQTLTTRLSTLPSGFGSGTNFNYPWGASIGWTDTLNASLINEAHVGFVRTTYGYMPPGNNTNICVMLGIVNCNTSLLGGISLNGGYNSQIEYTGDFGTYLVPQTGYNANDALTWVKGKHTGRFGGNIIRRQLNLFRPLAGKGYFANAGDGNGGCCGVAPGTGHVNTSYEVSDLLAGFVDGYAHGTTFGMVGTRTWENGFFAQDDYRVSPRLTLNLGLRYDILTWPVEVLNRQANFDLVTGALVVAGSNGASRNLIPNDYHNFGPRLGFAYQLTKDGKTVVRGGYGLFYFLDRGGISNQLAQNPPFAGTNGVSYAQGWRITLSGALPCSPNCPNQPSAVLNSTQATGPLPSGNFSNLNLAAPTGVSVIALLPINLTPMVSQWNLQVQRQIGVNQSVSVAYVGTHGARLTRNYDANQQLFGVPSGTKLYPNLGTITTQDNSGKSDYHSLQAQYEHRLTNGLTFTGAFTWSKTIDDSCGDLDSCAPQLYKNFAIERGLSNQDQPYRLVLSSLYELPFGRGKRWGHDISRALDYAVGGWQVNGIYVLQAGLPFSVTVDGNPSHTRADRTGNIGISPRNLANYINETYQMQVCPGINKNKPISIPVAPFALPLSSQGVGSAGLPCPGGIFNAPGTSGRDILRGPGSSNMDLAVFKNISVTEQTKVQLRVQAYNLTNTPHFANPDSDLNHGPGVFGQINSIQPFSWRQVELGLRVTF